MERVFLSDENAIDLFKQLCAKGFRFEYIESKRKIFFKTEENDNALSIRLPLGLEYQNNSQSLAKKDFFNYILLMIRSGQASMGFFENGELLDHKVFRAYMVRQKQGKSQIKHLKTKGKSRAGSRVRLAETLEFFEAINSRLQSYFSEYRIDLIGLSCSTTLIPYLFRSKVKTPFPKDDQRLIKIPKHIDTPSYEALLMTHEFLNKTEVEVFSDEFDTIFKLLINNNLQHPSENKDEDW